MASGWWYLQNDVEFLVEALYFSFRQNFFTKYYKDYSTLTTFCNNVNT